MAIAKKRSRHLTPMSDARTLPLSRDCDLDGVSPFFGACSPAFSPGFGTDADASPLTMGRERSWPYFAGIIGIIVLTAAMVAAALHGLRHSADGIDITSGESSQSAPAEDSSAPAAVATEPNPPHWPPSVRVFDASDKDIQQAFKELTSNLTDRKEGHFSKQRFAALFKPGIYDVDLNVGYYVQVLGLGESVEHVVFRGQQGVYSPAMDPGGAGSLDTFWRGAENFRSEASTGMLWAVSQAAPLRRVHVSKDLILHDHGMYASGGFMANVKVDGKIHFGSQQQWFSRNCDMQASSQGVWNYVFVGCRGAPASNYPLADDGMPAITSIHQTPTFAEKPFITIDRRGRYTLQIPKTRNHGRGADLRSVAKGDIKSVSFENVYVATEDAATDIIQAKLDTGLHVVLTPGIYKLSAPLILRRPGQTLLGLGLATLVAAADGSPCVRVLGGVPGVRIAGIMLEAVALEPGAGYHGSTLLEWGHAGDAGSSSDPGFIFDVFARVGGETRHAAVHTMVRIMSGNVIGDNLWLWRADHSKLEAGEMPGWNFNRPSEYHLVNMSECLCEHGLEVLGNNVTMFGLQVEHTLKSLTVWKGESGKTYFYQSELPYDVTQTSFADKGYTGYEVDAAVHRHEAYGIGVYSFFRDHPVYVDTAVVAPVGKNIHIVNPFVKYLDGLGGIMSVMNGLGEPADATTAFRQRLEVARRWPSALQLPTRTIEGAPLSRLTRAQDTSLLMPEVA